MVCAINVVAGIIEQQAFMDEMTTRIPLRTLVVISAAQQEKEVIRKLTGR